MIYLYLATYAESSPDVAFMAVNTFKKVAFSKLIEGFRALRCKNKGIGFEKFVLLKI